MKQQSDCVVIIPTYNEKENISAIIDAVMAQPHKMDVLIIDDGSPDGTAAIVHGLASDGGIHANTVPIRPRMNPRSWISQYQDIFSTVIRSLRERKGSPSFLAV